MMYIAKNKQYKSRKIIVVSIIAILLLVGAVVYKVVMSRSINNQSSTDNIRPVNTVDYSPPSQSDISTSQDAKKRGQSTNTENTDNDTDSKSNNSTTTKKQVAIGISYADVKGDKLEIRAFINGLIEGSGKCTATVTNGSKTITQSSDAFIDVSSSICKPIYIDTNTLSPGTWQVLVSYTSPDAVGTSDKVMVTI